MYLILGYEELWYGHPDIVLIPDEQPDYIPLSFYEEFPSDELDDENMAQERDVLKRNDRSTDVKQGINLLHIDYIKV